MNEQLLKVSALQSKSSFHNLEKTLWIGGIHPHPPPLYVIGVNRENVLYKLQARIE